MSHARLERQLSAYLDNELTAGDVQQVREHLADCAQCRQELERLQRVKRLLGALPARTPPTQLWNEVRSRLEAPAPGAVAALMDRVRTVFRRPALAAAAAAIIIVLIAVPLIRGRIDRLRAAEIGPDLFVREHALAAVTDPFADRAYIGLLISDANLTLVGEPRDHGEEMR